MNNYIREDIENKQREYQSSIKDALEDIETICSKAFDKLLKYCEDYKSAKEVKQNN